jgi:hypothetical protein
VSVHSVPGLRHWRASLNVANGSRPADRRQAGAGQQASFADTGARTLGRRFPEEAAIRFAIVNVASLAGADVRDTVVNGSSYVSFRIARISADELL